LKLVTTREVRWRWSLAAMSSRNAPPSNIEPRRLPTKERRHTPTAPTRPTQDMVLCRASSRHCRQPAPQSRPQPQARALQCCVTSSMWRQSHC
jgi:hypothetical protein